MPTQPTAQLVDFFELEIEEFLTNIRNGNIKPLDGFHPTLGSALDSLHQAPEEVALRWLGFDEDDEDSDVQAYKVCSVVMDLAWLIVEHGPNADLIDFVEQS